MYKSNINHWLFSTSLFCFAIYLLFKYHPAGDLKSWLIIITFSAAITVVYKLKTYLPTGEGFSFENALIISYVMVHGFEGIWVAALSVAGYSAISRLNLQEALFRLGRLVLVSWGSAAVFTVTGGNFGQIVLLEDYIPLLSFLVSFVFLGFILNAAYRTVLNDVPVKLVNLIKDQSLTTGLVIVVGLVSILMYQNAGLVGLGIVLLLIVGMWKMLSVYFYSEKKYIDTVETFLNLTENKIPHYRGHSERVSKLCQMVLKHLKVNREERNLIEYAALLHDVGKLGMPEKLLRIHSYLTSDEVRELENHPATGKKLVLQIHGMEKAADLIFSHHEKYNGEGYPEKLKGEQIPYGARVIAVADKLDNLIFRVGLRFEQACSELKNLAGTDLDPRLVEVFLDALLDQKNVAGARESQVTNRLDSGTKGIIEQLSYYLDKSWVLGTLQMSYIVIYEDGELRNLGHEPVPDSVRNYLSDFIESGSSNTCCHKEFIVDPFSASIFEAYFIPVSDASRLITVFDMTEVLKTEKDREEREQKIYRDVILAVTQGKLLLTFGEEINNYLTGGTFHSEMIIREAEDVGTARSIVRGIVENLPLTSKRKLELVLCVSEAATNVVKHVGEGKVIVCLLENAIRVIIEDNGPGIDVSQLPQATLRKGFSTKFSLGYGFTIMLDFLDRLIMSTEGGTTLIMEMSYNTGQTLSETANGKEVVQENAC